MEETLHLESSSIASILGTVGSPLIVITELIKNAIDASADSIKLIYDRELRSITVVDDGHGFTLEEIQQLSKPGFSKKKKSGNLRNSKGYFYTGSKGLGLLSVFSICDMITIQTTSDTDGEYIIRWKKNESKLFYDKIENPQLSKGTIITLHDVLPQVMTLLTSQAEIKKLRRISTYMYKHDDIKFPELTLSIDGNTPVSLYFKTKFSGMLFDVQFQYDNVSEILTFQCNSDRIDINNSKISIFSFEVSEIEKILDEHFDIIETIKTRTNDNMNFQELESVKGVPTFEGRILVFEKNTAGSMLKDHGAGVNVYVNDFAMYNYLSDEFDWLGLADFSQRKKATRLKPHNVFGFVNLPDFDESIEQLKISNERADFIQDTVYLKFMYLIKGVIMFMILNIDVAEKNPKYKRNTTLTSSVQENGAGYGGLNNGSENDEVTNEVDENQERLNSDAAGDNEESYKPEPAFRPRHIKSKYLNFTVYEGELINSIKGKDDLCNKIYQTIFELSGMNVHIYPYSTVCLYRTLIESSTQFASRNLEITYQEHALLTSITNVLNKWSANPKISKEFKQNIGVWRDLINRRLLIDKLNLYIHNTTPVDVDLILNTWNSMKGYIRECIKSKIIK